MKLSPYGIFLTNTILVKKKNNTYKLSSQLYQSLYCKQGGKERISSYVSKYPEASVIYHKKRERKKLQEKKRKKIEKKRWKKKAMGA